MRVNAYRAAIAAALLGASAPGLAQGQPPIAVLDGNSMPAAAPLQAPAEIHLPALTPVQLQLLEEVSSKTATPGAPVRLELARPLMVVPGFGIPAGTPVEGVVIHAARGGMGGKAGELLLGAKRIVLADGLVIPLRSFTLAPHGKSNENVAFGAAIAGGAVGGVAAMLIKGGSARAPAGTWAIAKTGADVTIPRAALSSLPPL